LRKETNGGGSRSRAIVVDVRPFADFKLGTLPDSIRDRSYKTPFRQKTFTNKLSYKFWTQFHQKTTDRNSSDYYGQ
jgi:hypothetical protein